MNSIDYSMREKVYAKAIDHYGTEPQILMVIEEMSELTKELCKFFRGKEDLKSIAEETADVTIMLEQLRIIFNMNDKVCEQMDSKVMRLASNLKMDVE